MSSLSANNGSCPANEQAIQGISGTPESARLTDAKSRPLLSINDSIKKFGAEWLQGGGLEAEDRMTSAKDYVKSRCEQLGYSFDNNSMQGFILFHQWFDSALPSQELPGLDVQPADHAPDLSVYTRVKLPTTNTDLGHIPNQVLHLELCTGRTDWTTGPYSLKASSALRYDHLLVVASVLRHWQWYGAPVKITENGKRWESAVSTFLGKIAKDLQGRRKTDRTSKPSGAEIDRVRRLINEVIEWSCLLTYHGSNGEEHRSETISFFENISYSRESKSKRSPGMGIGRFELELSDWLIRKFDSNKAIKPFYWATNKRDKNCEGLRVDMNLAGLTAMHDSSNTRAAAAGYPVLKKSGKVARLAPRTKQAAMAKRDAMAMQGRVLTDAFTHSNEDLQTNARCFSWFRKMDGQPFVSVFARVTTKQWDVLSLLGLTDHLPNQIEVFSALYGFAGSRLSGMLKSSSEKNILDVLKFIEHQAPWAPPAT